MSTVVKNGIFGAKKFEFTLFLLCFQPLNKMCDDDEVGLITRLLKRENCLYTSCYCEENVWQLCHIIKSNSLLNDVSVIFISNEGKSVPIWRQRATQYGDECQGLVIWDYHVVLAFKDLLIFDLDTDLEYPEKLKVYFDEAVKTDESLFKDQFKRKFRIIPGEVYLDKFASNRSHMLNSEGNYIKPPPDYPPIQTDESSNNLKDFISMDVNVGYGEILDCRQIKTHFKL